MAEKTLPIYVNFSDLTQKRNFLAHAGQLQGSYAVTLQPRKYLRSLNANAFYWACCVQPFRDWLRREYGDPLIELQDAHELLKQTLLPARHLVNRVTGEAMELPPSTAVLSIEEFSGHLQRVIAFLAEHAGIVVAEPIPKPKQLNDQSVGEVELNDQPVSPPDFD